MLAKRVLLKKQPVKIQRFKRVKFKSITYIAVWISRLTTSNKRDVRLYMDENIFCLLSLTRK